MPVTKTGQVKCYDMAGSEIACANSGEDGEYQKGLKRSYTRYSAGVVKDNATGLFWQDDYSDLGGASYMTGNWERAKRYCKKLSLGGINEWRLPSKYELIMLLERTSGSGGVNPVFQVKINEGVWSRSVYAKDSTKAWYIVFLNPYYNDAIGRKGWTQAIRCVYGTLPMHGRYSRKNDMVTDHRTNLVWQDNADAIDDPPKWEDALKRCEKLSLGGKNDWRLPNINELHTLVNTDYASPAMSPVFKNVIREDYGDYWSSTTYKKESNKAYGINTGSGDDFTWEKDYYMGEFVRCVRDKDENEPGLSPAVIMYLLN
jgi:hypothetical protein